MNVEKKWGEYYNPEYNNQSVNISTILELLRSNEERNKEHREQVSKHIDDIHKHIRSIDVVVNNGLTHRTKEIHQFTIENSNRIRNIEDILPNYAKLEELKSVLEDRAEADKAWKEARKMKRRFIISTLIGFGGLVVAILRFLMTTGGA